MDDGIRESHGCISACQNRVVLQEKGSVINIDAFSKDITPQQARYLARKLYRLARRIEARKEGTKS